MTKVIVIRGNSGSGKTTAAHALREAMLEGGATRKVALIEQDYFRRVVLQEREYEGSEALALIRVAATFAMARGFDVILEGILPAVKYGDMVCGLMEIADAAHAFYFDVSFEETVRRHATKPNAHDFGEAAMREWWLEHDVLGIDGETLLPESLSLDDAVAAMLALVDAL
jgi:adenylylsulfate kinase-like enzyme